MSDAPEQPDARQDGSIELEPAITPTMPQYIVPTPSDNDKPTDEGRPVPARPLHLCAECEYDLRGLTSRKCPECGTPFTLASARRVGLKYLPETKVDLTVAKTQRTLLHIGLALFAIAWIVPFIVTPTRQQPFFTTFRIVTILVFTTMCKIWSQQTWHKNIFVAGIVAAVIEGLLALI